MPDIAIDSAEDERQAAFLLSAADSQARYAAAMYFFMAGKLGAAELELYRVESKQTRSHPMERPRR